MRGEKPYLLSTTATLEKFGILYYDGYDFTWSRKLHRGYSPGKIKAVAAEVMHMFILPNAVIAKISGRHVGRKDCGDALNYAMTHGMPEETVKAWADFKEAERDGWMTNAIMNPVRMFALDISVDRKTGKTHPIPPDNAYDIRKYVMCRITSRRQQKRLRPYGNATSPALNALIDAFAKDRNVAKMTRADMCSKFGVSTHTVAKFNRWLKQRRDRGVPDNFLVMPRKTRKKDGKDKGDSAPVPGRAAEC